jgi:hypothetical protein
MGKNYDFFGPTGEKFTIFFDPTGENFAPI